MANPLLREPLAFEHIKPRLLGHWGTSPGLALVYAHASRSGVAAGWARGFGLVIVVNRAGQAKELAERCADLVVDHLGELLADVTEKAHRSGPRTHRLRAAARRMVAAGADHRTDPWRLIERHPRPDDAGRTESLFAVANGYLGSRGAHEEGDPAYRPATLLNGFHETWTIVLPEAAYGLATTGQTVVPVPDGTTVRILVDEDPVNMATTEVREYERTLNMAHATSSRAVAFQLPGGPRIRIASSRFVSLAHRYLARLRYDLTILPGPDGQAEPGALRDLIMSSELVTHLRVVTDPDADPRRTRSLAEDALRHDGEWVDGTRVMRMCRTAGSAMAVAAAMDHTCDPAALTHLHTRLDRDRACVLFAVRVAPGQTVTLVNLLAYHYGSGTSDALASRAAVTFGRAMGTGHASALDEHENDVSAFWTHSDVEWMGSQTAQQALRFSLFSLLQGTARSAGQGVSSKGQTGTGYEGHYFWDTEIYLLPFLIHTQPSIARAAVRSHDQDLYSRLVTRTGPRPGEPELWRRAAEKMHILYDARTGVHAQDDDFLDRKPWDFAGTPPEYPLLLHHHPLVIYRHQVIKQADVVLATVLLPERFTAEERCRIFDYYDPLTTGDSTLSEFIQAIAAADAGKYRNAEEYLVDAMAVDLADTAGNLRDGLHLASAAGTRMAVVYGFGGYRWRTREFAPMLPTRAQRIRFPFRLGRSVLEVTVEPRLVTYTVRRGDPVTARHRGEEFVAAAGRPVTFPGDYHTHDGARSRKGWWA